MQTSKDRPSSNWKRLEVIINVFIAFQLFKKNPLNFNERFKIFTPWQILLISLMGRYVLNRCFLLLGLNAPEVYAKHYNRNFYRATWILTALDAGFWTAMPIRPKFLRDTMSVFFSLWYLLFAEAADIKVRKFRSNCTVEMMRVSWEKNMNPILRLVGSFLRPRVGLFKELFVARKYLSSYPNVKPSSRIVVIYEGTKDELKSVSKVILHFHGGGFVTMKPENHEDYLRSWAKHLGKNICIISVDYCKAPEYPYPYAIEECFDVYRQIVETNGHIIGINMKSSQKQTSTGNFKKVRLCLVGDSAGGNLVACVTLKIISFNKDFEKKNPRLFDRNGDLVNPNDKEYLLPKPEGIFIIYGALNVNMNCWIPPSQAQLLRPNSSTSLSSLMKNYRGVKYHQRVHTNTNDNSESSDKNQPSSLHGLNIPYLSVTSIMSYFSDRIITPELARGMALLYLGQNACVNPATDMFISPVVAPEDLLAEFPKVWMMVGECDPFVDDTIVFAARIRAAVSNKFKKKEEYSSSEAALQNHKDNEEEFYSDSSDDSQYGEISEDPSHHVTVKIYAGLSHAFLNMLAFLPEAHHALHLCEKWLINIFDEGERIREKRRALRAGYRFKRQNTANIEMRDEDNIHNIIQRPIGAEYHSEASNAGPKFILGYPSEDEHEKPTASNFQDSPLKDAISETRRSIHQNLVNSSKVLRKSHVKFAKQKVTIGENNPDESSHDLFLQEHELVNKRRVDLTRDIYHGVDVNKKEERTEQEENYDIEIEMT